MVVVLITGGVLGWVIHRARVQREAVAAIRRSGGSVTYRHQSMPRSSGMPSWPRWAAEILGVDYFDDVRSVYLEFKESDLVAELAHVGRLRRLEELYLASSQVTDAGLASLAGLGNLRKLDLDSTEVTNARMAYLEGLTGLWFLNLSHTEVGDAGLAHLRGLSGLTDLFLEGTKAGDAGIIHLKGLSRLRYLSLEGTAIGDVGMAHLARLRGSRS
jgi:hypothetical protein